MPAINETVTYNASPLPSGATVYGIEWTISGGGTIQGNPPYNQSSIQVTWNSPGTHTVSCEMQSCPNRTGVKTVEVTQTLFYNNVAGYFENEITYIKEGCGENCTAPTGTYYSNFTVEVGTVTGTTQELANENANTLAQNNVNVDQDANGQNHVNNNTLCNCAECPGVLESITLSDLSAVTGTSGTIFTGLITLVVSSGNPEVNVALEVYENEAILTQNVFNQVANTGTNTYNVSFSLNTTGNIYARANLGINYTVAETSLCETVSILTDSVQISICDPIWEINGTTCSGFNKYYREQNSCTGEFRTGDLIEENSTDCGYTEPCVYPVFETLERPEGAVLFENGGQMRIIMKTNINTFYRFYKNSDTYNVLYFSTNAAAGTDFYMYNVTGSIPVVLGDTYTLEYYHTDENCIRTEIYQLQFAQM